MTLPPGTLGNPDTVATQVYGEHQLKTDPVTGLLAHIGISSPLYTCTCGRMKQGDATAGALHLVEMGVEAGAAAIMEMRAAQAAEPEPELTTEELAQRDLAGYMHGMEARYRQNPREPWSVELTGWRDQLAILVECAADTSIRHPQALELGARLWVELEAWEAHTANLDPTSYGRHTEPAAAYRHSSSAQADVERQAAQEAAQLPVVSCPERRPHGPHHWRIQHPTELYGESKTEEAICDGRS